MSKRTSSSEESSKRQKPNAVHYKEHEIATILWVVCNESNDTYFLKCTYRKAIAEYLYEYYEKQRAIEERALATKDEATNRLFLNSLEEMDATFHIATMMEDDSDYEKEFAYYENICHPDPIIMDCALTKEKVNANQMVTGYVIMVSLTY